VHDVQQARKAWCAAPRRPGVFASRAPRSAGLLDITPSFEFNRWGRPVCAQTGR